MALEKLIAKKRLMIVCGAGGVGKTTLSAALAWKGAMAGKKALVITVDPAKRLAGLLRLRSPCPDPKPVWRDAKSSGVLFACLLEAKQTFDALISKHAPASARAAILDHPLYAQVSSMLAGTQEYMAMEKLFSLSEGNQFDLIVVDTPPARQAIDFLLAPIRLINLLNDSLLRWLVAPTVKMGTLGSKILSALSNLSGKEILEDIAQLMQISFAMLDGFTQRSGAIQARLAGKACAFVLATDCQRAATLNTQRLREAFAQLGYELEGILVNRFPPDFGKPKDIAAAADWVRQQKDPIWERAVQGLIENQQLGQALRRKLKTLEASVPHWGLVPEQPKGVVSLADLQTLAAFI